MNPKKNSVSTKIFSSTSVFNIIIRNYFFLIRNYLFFQHIGKFMCWKLFSCAITEIIRGWLLIVIIFNTIIVLLYFVSKKCRLREHKTLLSKTLLHISDPKLCVMCFSCPRERHIRAGGRKWDSACSGSDFKKKEHAHYSHCQTGSWTGQRW